MRKGLERGIPDTKNPFSQVLHIIRLWCNTGKRDQFVVFPTMAPRIMQEVDAIRHNGNDQGDDRRLSDVNKSSVSDYKWEFTSPKKDRRPLRPSRAHELPQPSQDTPTRRSAEQCTPTKANWTPSNGGCNRNSTGMIPDEIHVLLSKSLSPPNVGQYIKVNNLLSPRRDEAVSRGDVNKWASPKKDKRPSAPLSRGVREPTCDCIHHRWSDITPTPNLLSSPPPPTSNEARILELQVELLELLLAQHQHVDEDDIDSSAFVSPRTTESSKWVTSSPKWESLNNDSRPLRPIKNLSCNNTLAGSSICSSFAAGMQSEDERSVVSLNDTRPSCPRKQNSFSYCSLAGSSFCSSSYGAGVLSEDERSLASLKDARPVYSLGQGSVAYSDTIATSANSSFAGGFESEEDDVKSIDY